MQVKRQTEPPTSSEDPPQSVILKFNDGPYMREFTGTITEEGIENVLRSILDNFRIFLKQNSLEPLRKEK